MAPAPVKTTGQAKAMAPVRVTAPVKAMVLGKATDPAARIMALWADQTADKGKGIARLLLPTTTAPGQASNALPRTVAVDVEPRIATAATRGPTTALDMAPGQARVRDQVSAQGPAIVLVRVRVLANVLVRIPALVNVQVPVNALAPGKDPAPANASAVVPSALDSDQDLTNRGHPAASATSRKARPRVPKP